jgi:hypothetical protein
MEGDSEDIEWIHFEQDRAQLKALINMELNLWAP